MVLTIISAGQTWQRNQGSNVEGRHKYLKTARRRNCLKYPFPDDKMGSCYLGFSKLQYIPSKMHVYNSKPRHDSFPYKYNTRSLTPFEELLPYSRHCRLEIACGF